MSDTQLCEAFDRLEDGVVDSRDVSIAVGDMVAAWPEGLGMVSDIVVSKRQREVLLRVLLEVRDEVRGAWVKPGRVIVLRDAILKSERHNLRQSSNPEVVDLFRQLAETFEPDGDSE